MVAEFYTKHDAQGKPLEWEAVLAERLPTILDDEIKKHHAAFSVASDKLTPEQVYDALPISYPMTNVVDPNEMPGIARYPVWRWERGGAVCLTQAMWCKICMKIAENDMENLGLIFDKAQEMLSRVTASSSTN